MSSTTDLASTTISQRFARFIASLSIETLPATLIEQAKIRILDSLATAIASQDLPVPAIAMALVGDNRGRATIIGHPRTVPAIDAALVNATRVNARSQDDFLCKSHPGAVTLPAALALAEAQDASGADLIAAVVAGYEIVGRVYLGGPDMVSRFRATGVAGTIAAAAAAARVLKLDAEQTGNALGCAAVFASGFGAGFLSGTDEVKLNVGMACRNGASAALLARAGASASPLAFEGDAGFYRATAGSLDALHHASEGLGERYLLAQTVYKEFPVCIFVQTPMALARELVRARPLRAHDAVRITVTVSPSTYAFPGLTNVAPFTSSLQARVSARFCVAAALLDKPISDYAFYEHFDAPDVLALAARIDLVADPDSSDNVVVSIDEGGETRSLEGIEGETLVSSAEKVIAKFHRLASPVLGSHAQSVLQGVLRLEHLPNLHDLTAPLRTTAAPTSALH